jgi:hypothetical protein
MHRAAIPNIDIKKYIRNGRESDCIDDFTALELVQIMTSALDVVGFNVILP